MSVAAAPQAAAAPAPLLEVNDLHTYYGHSYVLQGLSLKVNPGEIVAVVGRNGVGKTTLVRSIIGFTPPRRGSIRFDDKELAGCPPEFIVRQGVALVPQGRRVFRSLRAEENLTTAAHLKRFDRHKLNWPLSKVYDAFPRLLERRNQRAGSLSGGEQQMLAVGRAIVGYPRLVLLDEPTEGLSPLLIRELRTLLGELKAHGQTMLLIEQRLRFALALADRVYVMTKGQIVAEMTPDELMADTDLRHRYLGV